MVKEYKIWLTDNSIVIYTPKHKSFFEKTAKEAYKRAIYKIFSILKATETLLNTSFRIKKGYVFDISRQHYGKIKDNLATYYNERDMKLSIEQYGERWLLIDKSPYGTGYNFNEIEAVNRKTAIPDMDKVIDPFLNDLREHYIKTGESIKITDLINVNAEMMKTQARNIRDISLIAKKLKQGDF